MKIKKLVNAVSALAMAVSVFASMTAYADDTVYCSQNYEADGATVDWTTATSGRFTPVLLTETDSEGTVTNTYLSVDQSTRNNNGATITGTTVTGSVAAGTDFTMEWDMKLSSSTNQQPATFTLYDAANSTAMFSLTATGTWTSEWYINGNKENKVTLSSCGNAADISTLPWYHFLLTRSGNVTLLTVTDADDATVYERTAVDTLSSTGGLGNMTFATRRYNANFAIDNVEVRTVAESDLPEIAVVNYAINYVCDGTTVKTVSGSNYAGEMVEADSTLWSDAGVKYFATGDATTSMTLAEGADNELNVTVREAELYTAVVNAVYNEEIINTESETAYEGETVSVYYPKYVLYNGIYYSTEAIDARNGAYVYDFSEAGSQNVDYAETDADYVFEVNDMTLSGSGSSSGAYPDRYSNGNALRLWKNTYVYADTVIDSGVYTVTIWSRNQSSSTGGSVELYLRNAETGELTDLETSIGSWAAGGYGEMSATEVVIPDGYQLVLNNTTTYNSNLEMDYVVLTKTSEILPSAVNAELAEDFADETAEDAATGASIWTATISGTGVAYSTIKAVATAVAGGEAEGTYDATTISGDADVSVIVVVDRMASLLSSVVVSVVE